MSNWGTAMPGWVSPPVGAGADVACPAGTETNVLIGATNLILPNAVDYFLMVSGVMVVTFGASPPTALSIGARIQGAADFDSQTIYPSLLVASATLICPFTLSSPTSRSLWANTAGPVCISVNPTAQAVTARANGSRYCLAALVGFDV